MGSLPKELNEKWKAEHYRTSEKEFERVAIEGQSTGGPSFFKTAEVEEKKEAEKATA